MDYVPATQWRTLPWGTPARIGRTSTVYLHHGASGRPTLATLRAYERHHVATNGWQALGYSWAVTSDGTIYEGRGWHRAGAHTQGHNTTSHAIVLVGDWTSGRVPQLMVDACARIIADGRQRGALAPDCVLRGHRQAPGASTQCPGQAGMVAMPRIRTALAHTPEEDWFTMATEDDLRRIIREEVGPAAWSHQVTDPRDGQVKNISTIVRYTARDVRDAYVRLGVVRDHAAGALRLAQAAATYAVAAMRDRKGLDEDPHWDAEHAQRMRTHPVDEYGLTEVRDRLDGAAE